MRMRKCLCKEGILRKLGSLPKTNSGADENDIRAGIPLSKLPHHRCVFERVFLQAFPDDLALVTAGSVRKELEINTNEALELIHLTLVELKLELSVGKCQGLSFRSLVGHQKRKRQNIFKRKPIFKINGQSIRIGESLKYLGLLLDSRLTWSSHILSLHAKVYNLTNNFSRILKTDWNLDKELVKIWYLTVIEKALLYGAGVWGGALTCDQIKRLHTSGESRIRVYIDGSKVDGGVGFSVCILHGEIQHKIICKKLEPQNTVFQAELGVLGEAVDWAIENKKKINIYTDSRSSIKALKSCGSRSKFVISIKNKFFLAEGLVGLVWVKAHVGIPGNELANHFAKLASVEGEGMDIPFPYSFVKSTLKKKLLEDWQIYYGACETASGNRIRSFVPRVDTKTLIKSKYLIYFLTGHGPFPCYLSRFKILSSPLCECGSLGDPDHYLFDCLMTRDHQLKKPSCEAKSLWLKT
ncbi:hypothetical protein AVEN_197808-1 [Araneus ventricosus]|uniref:RNase H type-1 domain-containing protein n=1 Tax=Araneus ventricosus TaxID=182803 RepID=A0A4Y2NKX6_ARAVE|nr:hypothetical protein AVEN_197808-1 [Araneus ventricosus]